MIVSFDLDGVVADTDSAVLAMLHQQEIDGVPGATGRVLRYYATRQLRLNPWEFVAAVDTVAIVTGRNRAAHEITCKWVDKNVRHCVLQFATTAEIEELFQQEQYEEASALLAHRKLDILHKIGAQVHIDNNPVIVRLLRANGLVAIQYGGSVCAT